MKNITFLVFMTSSLLWAEQDSLKSTSLEEKSATPSVLVQDSSGVEWQTLQPGQGKVSSQGDILTLHYSGKVKGGNEFDNSRKRGKAFSFVLGAPSVIAGWNIALEGMQAGETRFLRVPPSLGYGSRDLGVIPSNSTLEFEVELVSIAEGLKPDTLPDFSSLVWEDFKGMKISRVQTGNGAQARGGDEVSLHYTGWLEGGSSFGSSKLSGKAVQFRLGGGEVVPGWEKAMLGSSPGDVFYLQVPAHLGYGDRPLTRIPAHSKLFFKIEVDGIAPRADTGEYFPEVANIPWVQSVSGLESHIEQEGNGDAVAPGQKVSVHYTGWLLDGTRFDSSRLRKQTFSFVVGQKQVIAGWDEALVGMKVGEKKMLKIPAHLAYGSKGNSSIPANSTLIFAVELVSIP